MIKVSTLLGVTTQLEVGVGVTGWEFRSLQCLGLFVMRLLLLNLWLIFLNRLLLLVDRSLIRVTLRHFKLLVFLSLLLLLLAVTLPILLLSRRRSR